MNSHNQQGNDGWRCLHDKRLDEHNADPLQREDVRWRWRRIELSPGKEILVINTLATLGNLVFQWDDGTVTKNDGALRGGPSTPLGISLDVRSVFLGAGSQFGCWFCFDAKLHERLEANFGNGGLTCTISYQEYLLRQLYPFPREHGTAEHCLPLLDSLLESCIPEIQFWNFKELNTWSIITTQRSNSAELILVHADQSRIIEIQCHCGDCLSLHSRDGKEFHFIDLQLQWLCWIFFNVSSEFCIEFLSVDNCHSWHRCAMPPPFVTEARFTLWTQAGFDIHIQWDRSIQDLQHPIGRVDKHICLPTPHGSKCLSGTCCRLLGNTRGSSCMPGWWLVLLQWSELFQLTEETAATGQSTLQCNDNQRWMHLCTDSDRFQAQKLNWPSQIQNHWKPSGRSCLSMFLQRLRKRIRRRMPLHPRLHPGQEDHSTADWHAKWVSEFDRALLDKYRHWHPPSVRLEQNPPAMTAALHWGIWESQKSPMKDAKIQLTPPQTETAEPHCPPAPLFFHTVCRARHTEVCSPSQLQNGQSYDPPDSPNATAPVTPHTSPSLSFSF